MMFLILSVIFILMVKFHVSAEFWPLTVGRDNDFGHSGHLMRFLQLRAKAI